MIFVNLLYLIEKIIIRLETSSLRTLLRTITYYIIYLMKYSKYNCINFMLFIHQPSHIAVLLCVSIATQQLVKLYEIILWLLRTNLVVPIKPMLYD